MILDCFLFFNELDLLKLRLTENYNYIDYFILVESNITFSGEKKNYIFEENKELFSKFLNKIIHLKITDTPITNNPWEREQYQRNYLLNGIKSLQINNNDIIFLSDCDEIIDNTVIQYIKQNGLTEQVYSLNMDVYYYNYCCKSNEEWYKVKVFTYNLLRKLSLDTIRTMNTTIFPLKGGWHFSYFGGIENIQNKIKAFSHQEYNNNKYLNESHLKNCTANLTDLYNREINYIYIPYKQNKYLPSTIK